MSDLHAFAITPAGARPLWLLLPVACVLVGASVLLLLSFCGAQWARFELSPEGLRLRGDLYGRFIPRAQLRSAEARRVGPQDSDLTPRTRTLGTGLPGYQAGWFRLRNGEEALLYLTDRKHSVYIPTDAGYSLLISPADPEAFLAALKTLADEL